MNTLHITITAEVSHERYYNSTLGKADAHLELPVELFEAMASSPLLISLLREALATHRTLLEAEALQEADDDTDEAGE